MTSQLIDMSKLPPPQVVSVPDFETLLAGLKADLVAAYPPAADVIELESEPLTKWLERLAYQIITERSKVNDSALAVMLPYATGSDLDVVGSLFDTPRLVIVEANPNANPPIEQVLEDDEAFRERIHLAPRGYTTAGPEGSYVYHARSASGQVLDAKATSPSPGQVVVSVLSRNGDGTADAGLLATVQAALSAKDIRPMTDEVITQSATVVNYTIVANVITLPGPDAATVIEAGRQRLLAYTEQQRRIGRQPTLSGIYGALQVPGVHRIELSQPAAEPVVSETESWRCTSITLTPGGIDE